MCEERYIYPKWGLLGLAPAAFGQAKKSAGWLRWLAGSLAALADRQRLFELLDLNFYLSCICGNKMLSTMSRFEIKKIPGHFCIDSMLVPGNLFRFWLEGTSRN